jgi:hypothetical protein
VTEKGGCRSLTFAVTPLPFAVTPLPFAVTPFLLQERLSFCSNAFGVPVLFTVVHGSEQHPNTFCRNAFDFGRNAFAFCRNAFAKDRQPPFAGTPLLFRCCSLLFTVLNNCSRTRTTVHRSTHTLLSTPLLHFSAEHVETVVHVLFMCCSRVHKTKIGSPQMQ